MKVYIWWFLLFSGCFIDGEVRFEEVKTIFQVMDCLYPAEEGPWFSLCFPKLYYLYEIEGAGGKGWGNRKLKERENALWYYMKEIKQWLNLSLSKLRGKLTLYFKTRQALEQHGFQLCGSICLNWPMLSTTVLHNPQLVESLDAKLWIWRNHWHGRLTPKLYMQFFTLCMYGHWVLLTLHCSKSLCI